MIVCIFLRKDLGLHQGRQRPQPNGFASYINETWTGNE
jgi:hypothetical protein